MAHPEKPLLKVGIVSDIQALPSEHDWGFFNFRNALRIFREKGIEAWCDFWGPDVNHDWPWWFRQMRYFLPFMINEERT